MALVPNCGQWKLEAGDRAVEQIGEAAVQLPRNHLLDVLVNPAVDLRNLAFWQQQHVERLKLYPGCLGRIMVLALDRNHLRDRYTFLILANKNNGTGCRHPVTTRIEHCLEHCLARSAEDRSRPCDLSTAIHDLPAIRADLHGVCGIFDDCAVALLQLRAAIACSLTA